MDFTTWPWELRVCSLAGPLTCTRELQKCVVSITTWLGRSLPIALPISLRYCLIMVLSALLLRCFLAWGQFHFPCSFVNTPISTFVVPVQSSSARGVRPCHPPISAVLWALLASCLSCDMLSDPPHHNHQESRFKQFSLLEHPLLSVVFMTPFLTKQSLQEKPGKGSRYAF